MKKFNIKFILLSIAIIILLIHFDTYAYEDVFKSKNNFDYSLLDGKCEKQFNKFILVLKDAANNIGLRINDESARELSFFLATHSCGFDKRLNEKIKDKNYGLIMLANCNNNDEVDYVAYKSTVKNYFSNDEKWYFMKSTSWNYGQIITIKNELLSIADNNNVKMSPKNAEKLAEVICTLGNKAWLTADKSVFFKNKSTNLSKILPSHQEADHLIFQNQNFKPPMSNNKKKWIYARFEDMWRHIPLENLTSDRVFYNKFYKPYTGL